MLPNQLASNFVEYCSSDPCPQTVLAKLASCAKSLGFDHLLLSGLPPPNGRIEEYMLANHWPQEWYDRYTGRNYFHIDGVGQWAMRAFRPFTYEEVPDMFRLPSEARKVRAEAADFGLVYGIVVPIRSAGYRQFVLSFSGCRRCDLGPQDRAALHLIGIYALGSIRDAHDHAVICRKLSAREREVLAWAAQGKSAWETSAILSISERTVAKHLEHIRAKLNVATTAQAVAEGLRCGEITL